MGVEEAGTVGKHRLHRITANDEIGYFAPKTWEFWRALIAAFCICTIVGHWLELLYCVIMDALFGIVAPDYVVWTDPWYHPYWVYGVGAVAMTLVIEPLKEYIVVRCKTLWGALLATFAITVILSMVLELVIGLLVNQPDEFGKYPFWDNSQLPFNILGQAWLVNDVFIGLVAVLYVWLIYPLICEMFGHMRPRAANWLLAFIIVAFAGCCTLSYLQLWLGF